MLRSFIIIYVMDFLLNLVFFESSEILRVSTFEFLLNGNNARPIFKF